VTPGLHPTVRAAARGELPPWAAADAARQALVDGAWALLDGWAHPLASLEAP
jgi:hypothetical protein